MSDVLRDFLGSLTEQGDVTTAVESLLDAGALPMLVTDAEERVVLANAAVCSRLGLPVRETVGRPFNLLWRERVEERNGRLVDLRQPIRTTSGAVVGHVHVLEEPRDGDGGRTAALADRVAELERANADLKALETTRNHLLSNVSHELRTPLVTIIGYVEMVTAGELGEIPDEVAASLKVVLRNALRLSSRIDDLINLTRLQEEEIQPFFEDVPLRTVVDALLTEYRLLLEEKRLVVDIELPPDLPAARADRRLTSIAIENLLKNALKFSRREGRIAIRGALRDGRVRIEIRDEGAGIPAEHLSRVFEPFFQVDSSPTRAHGGIGVGLAIVRRIVQAHGGHVDLKSEVGAGTTVTLELPVAGESPVPV